MDLNELQSVKSRERQTAELQQLRESFYEEVGEYLDQLERERERAAEAADDPFSDPEVQRLTDDIETAKGTVESLYERRIGKVVKQASLEAADMGAETGGLTTEERDAFESIVATIERNRERVLDGVVAGEDVDVGAAGADGTDRSPEPPREDADGPARAGGDRDRERDRPTEAVPDDASAPVSGADRPDFEAEAAVLGEERGVDAADLMGDGAESASASGGEPSSEGAPSPSTPDGTASPDGGAAPADRGATAESRPGDVPTAGTGASDDAGGDGREDAAGAPTESADGDVPPDASEVSHATVRVTADVGEILGVDDRAYDLSEEDVVRLPEANAAPLVERDAAERL